MPANPPENVPQVSPYLLYEDVAGALEWLSKAFGLRERTRVADASGTVHHAEMEIGDGLIMMGCPGPDYQSPRRHGHVTASLYVYVDDVDVHFDQARAAGATIFAEPEDQLYGDRRYGARDPEGHEWYFAQYVRDVPPEELKMPTE
jgi:PhnB protein